MLFRSGIKTVLFDMDGTLVPMDVKEFMDCYFGELGKKAVSAGYDAEETVKAVWSATKEVMKNDGQETNYDRFWRNFKKLTGDDSDAYKNVFDNFYINELDTVRRAVKENTYARQIIDFLKNKGYKIILATNPLFPEDGNITRLKWVGLEKADFDYITSYENSKYCKPDPRYYEEIMEKNGCDTETSVMIGNDVKEDLAAGLIGIDTYLVTDCLINSEETDITDVKKGTFKELYEAVIAEM